MKIVDLQIYGYGQLENVHIQLFNDVQVFYGENEAGKSTIMAFIHGILFGFPTKQQSNDLRYEPKNGAKYGGKITLLHDHYGRVVIERIKGKSAGDVKVVLEDGTAGGEELLKQLLFHFDKNVYQAIFSFNLHGLQNIHQMKGEELGRFLFSAGTLGTDRLAQTENLLQKEMDTRFKPGGRKPVLNEKLHELHELNGELKNAAAKNKEYEVLNERKEGLKLQLEEIDQSLKEIQDYAEKLNEWKRIHTLVKEEQFVKKELLDLGEVQFPIRGINRLEQLKQLLHPCKAQITSISERIEALKQEIAILKPNSELLESEAGILALMDQLPLQEQWNLEKRQLETKIKEYEEKIVTFKEKLHLSLPDDIILQINTNIYMKDRVEKLSRKTLKLQEEKEVLDTRFHEEKIALENLEKDVRHANAQVLSDKERKELEAQLEEGSDKKHLEMEWNSVKEKIVLFQQAKEQETKNQRQKQQQFLIIELLIIGITLYGLFAKEWILVLLGVIGTIIVVFNIINGVSSKGKSEETERLKERERQLFQKLQSSDSKNLSLLDHQLQMDNRLREHLQLLNIKLEQQQIQYERVISQFEAWELETSQHNEMMVTISKELKIPVNIASSYLLDAFLLIEQYKAIVRERNQLFDKVEQINLELKKVEQGLNEYSDRFLLEKGANLHRKALLLKQQLKTEEEKLIKSKEKQLKLSELTADLKQKNIEQAHLQLQIENLYKDAGACSDEEFYQLGRKAEKYNELKTKLENLEKQLQYSLLPAPEWESFLQNHHIEEDINQTANQIQSLHERKTISQEELASIKYEQQVLEEGGMYTDLLHQYKQKRYELDEAAKEWAVFTIAQDILQKTIERYKDTHFPRMLAKAEEYLSFLTEGNYQKIHLRDSGTGFLIERKDHTIFEANELSQATAEQVYVSIRFALAVTLYDKYHLPIIIDDSFVNFDEKRTSKVIDLLRELKGNQILFFTCHRHLLKYFNKENILSLEKGALKIS